MPHIFHRTPLFTLYNLFPNFMKYNIYIFKSIIAFLKELIFSLIFLSIYNLFIRNCTFSLFLFIYTPLYVIKKKNLKFILLSFGLNLSYFFFCFFAKDLLVQWYKVFTLLNKFLNLNDSIRVMCVNLV